MIADENNIAQDEVSFNSDVEDIQTEVVEDLSSDDEVLEEEKEIEIINDKKDDPVVEVAKNELEKEKVEKKTTKQTTKKKESTKQLDPKTIQEHILVPKHELMSKQDVQRLLEDLKIDDLKNLPKISQADPALIGLNAVKGDVIKITRNSVTAGKSVYYRLVI